MQHCNFFTLGCKEMLRGCLGIAMANLLTYCCAEYFPRPADKLSVIRSFHRSSQIAFASCPRLQDRIAYSHFQSRFDENARSQRYSRAIVCDRVFLGSTRMGKGMFKLSLNPSDRPDQGMPDICSVAEDLNQVREVAKNNNN